MKSPSKRAVYNVRPIEVWWLGSIWKPWTWFNRKYAVVYTVAHRNKIIYIFRGRWAQKRAKHRARFYGRKWFSERELPLLPPSRWN
jgi:hypothetical protein